MVETNPDNTILLALAPATNQAKDANKAEPPRARFQRTDQWMPVYSWLESLNKNEVVKSKEITDWLSENPIVKEQLYSRHSRYHLMHYIQKCHSKMLRRREKQKGVQHSKKTAPMKVHSNVVALRAVSHPSNSSKDADMNLARQNEAFRRFELFTYLESHLSSLLTKHKQVNNLKESGSSPLLKQTSADNTNNLLSSDMGK